MMNRILRSAPFTDVFWARSESGAIADHSGPCGDRSELSVRAYLPPWQRIVLTGDALSLGAWDPRSGISLQCAALPLWHTPASVLGIGDQYKFVIMQGDQVIQWEEGENRIYDGRLSLDTDDFRGVPSYMPRLAGVAIPVFSIRTAQTEGIGDFLSLGEFASWACLAGQRVVQTLPVNDTTITHTHADSYPYKSISIFALHPLYIRLSELGVVSSELQRLNTLLTVDYDAVDAEKWRLLRQAYREQGQEVIQSEVFEDFFVRNHEWLIPYAVFSYLRDRFQTAEFSRWEAPYNIYDERLTEKVRSEHGDEIKFYYFIQFHADRQLRMARDAARGAGVVLKGDIPIGVSRDSVEAWSEPHLFNMNGQAGAPPDDFSADGQNWGFPTYNWDEMAKDGYAWWKARFGKMSDYFDMYRIDHILGFFRIWEIPISEKGGLMGHFSPALPFSADELARWGLPMYEERYLGVDNADHNTLFVRDHTNPKLYHPRIAAQGTDRYKYTLDDYEKERFNTLYNSYFYERNNQFWAEQAFKKLPSMIDSTNMLCCAEDLGMIPRSVASTLSALEVVTLEIQRMPKDPSQLFGIPALYPYMSVCTTSSHDMTPLREWWRENRDKTQQYFNQVMWWSGVAFQDATTDVCYNIVMQHLNSPSMAAILPLQDWLSVDDKLRAADPMSERINIPSDPNHYWRYRMHLTVEELNQADEFNDLLLDMVGQSGRIL